MKKVTFCKRCLYTSDHPLGLTIDAEGICSGCRIHEEKNTLDWGYKWDRLLKLTKPYKANKSQVYDCIVPVSGAQDSYFIVHVVKNLLGMNPLLVTYNKYWNTPLGIKNLANLRIKFNCDILIQNVNPLSVKKITKESIRKFGSLYWHCIAGQTVFPVQTAVRYKIPLIIWGAHQGMEQVGMFSHNHEVEMTRRYRKDHDLMGYEPENLIGFFNNISENDIWQYRYPDDQELNDIGVRGIYLNNFIRWDPKAQHELMIDLYDYKTSRFNRTFDCYDYVDCYNYMDLHDEIKRIKTGFSKVTDHATREIRHGRLSRDVALCLVKYYESKPLLYKHKILDWLGINDPAFNFVIDQFRNLQYWKKDVSNNWQSIKNYTDGFSVKGSSIFFNENSSLSLSEPDEFITIGKGYYPNFEVTNSGE